jgi:hypothetical protein
MVAVELDWMKVYDSVDRWVKEVALRRLGLAYDFIDYLLEFDRRNEQRVRTYYGATGAGSTLRVGVELARRVAVLRAAMYSLLSWTGCLRWLSAAVKNL